MVAEAVILLMPTKFILREGLDVQSHTARSTGGRRRQFSAVFDCCQKEGQNTCSSNYDF